MQELLNRPTRRYVGATPASPLQSGSPMRAGAGTNPPKTAKVAYFIASHVNPAQVARLVGACRSGSPESRVLIHHDYNVSNLDSKTLGRLGNIDFLTGQPAVQWGMFSMCAMVL